MTQIPEVADMPDDEPDRNPKPQLSPTALTLPEAALVLSKAGGRLVTEELLRNDVDAGAPANPDGTLNLVNYAAWLIKELSQSGD